MRCTGCGEETSNPRWILEGGAPMKGPLCPRCHSQGVPIQPVQLPKFPVPCPWCGRAPDA